MSEKILLEHHFLEFIAHSVNFKQIAATLRECNPVQILTLREIALNIIATNGAIQMDGNDDHYFNDTEKEVIVLLSQGKLSPADLSKQTRIITEIVRLALQHYAVCG